MKQIKKYQNKNILILGLAKSGYAAAKLLHQLGASIVVNDQQDCEDNEQAQELKGMGMDVICGGHPLSILERPIDLIVKNPGIPYRIPILQEATEKNIPIITEVELAYEITEANIIGITGSNGKTTTTTLIYEMLKADGKNPEIAGNIGEVACEKAAKCKKGQWLVMELSSFQLKGIDSFKPKISILLNLYDAHLDYHGTKDDYAHSKGNLVKNQTEEDCCVINYDQTEVLNLTESCRAKKVGFSLTQKLESGAYMDQDAVYFNQEKIIDKADIVLPGNHNLENVLAAISAAKLAGASNQAICSVLKTFTGVKHRLQFVKDVEARKFYNDSKATNILAATTAIQAFEQPVILLAGGLDRGNDFDALIPALKSVKAVITFGQTAEKIKEASEKAGIKMIKHVDNVEKAVPAAYKLSSPGDIVLLSPACASWDQFKTFEQRGDMFVQSVHKL